MGSKKKKKKHNVQQQQNHHATSRAAVKETVAEELVAISAIFPDEFSLHEDGIGFQLLCVPHPGNHISNHCSVELHIRCAPSATAVGCRRQQRAPAAAAAAWRAC